MIKPRLFFTLLTITILLSAGNWLWERPLTDLVASVTRSQTDLKEMDMRFPAATGSNLQRQKLNLPADFEGDLNIVLIAFQQWQQNTIDTWLPYVMELEQHNDGVRYYELPVIRNMNFIARTFINEGMRAGIPDSTARDRTITLYLEKEAFRQSLEILHEQDIYILLVDREGDVIWRSEGAFDRAKGEALSDVIEEKQELSDTNPIREES